MAWHLLHISDVSSSGDLVPGVMTQWTHWNSCKGVLTCSLQLRIISTIFHDEVNKEPGRKSWLSGGNIDLDGSIKQLSMDLFEGRPDVRRNLVVEVMEGCIGNITQIVAT